MAEFEDKLNAILGDPEAMGQIVSIAKALTSGMEQPAQEMPSPPDGNEGTSAPPPVAEPASDIGQPSDTPASPSTQTGETQSGPDWGAVMSLLGGLGGSGGQAASPLGLLGDLDPKMIQTALRLFSEYSATDDRKTTLLAALKPFLKPERYAKVDKAIQIAKLSRVVRVAFQLFKKEGEGDV